MFVRFSGDQVLQINGLDRITRQGKLNNLEAAFRVANENFSIPRLLDPVDLVDFQPDFRSMYIYLVEYVVN
jgi:hypothetical protein